MPCRSTAEPQPDNLQTLQTASGIEADRSTRLWELWYQQKFLDEDRLDIKIGQQSLDQEFMVSQNASYFVNTMFGWPMVPSADLPGGGPAYPLSALGVRVRDRPIDSLTFLLGVFNGSPVNANNSGDPQMVKRSGTSFPLNGGVLVIGEMQYQLPCPRRDDQRGHSRSRWRAPTSWASGTTPRVSPTSSSTTPACRSPIPRATGCRWAITAISASMPSPTRWSGSIRMRATARSACSPACMGAPQADRNLITFSVNAGLTFHEPFLHRDDDTFGIGMGFAKVSGSCLGAGPGDRLLHRQPTSRSAAARPMSRSPTSTR